MSAAAIHACAASRSPSGSSVHSGQKYARVVSAQTAIAIRLTTEKRAAWYGSPRRKTAAADVAGVAGAPASRSAGARGRHSAARPRTSQAETTTPASPSGTHANARGSVSTRHVPTSGWVKAYHAGIAASDSDQPAAAATATPPAKPPTRRAKR